MQEHIERRITPVTHTPENQRIVDLVNRIRGAGAHVMVEARMGTETTIHPRIGTLEQRLASMEALGQQIMDLAAELYPNRQVHHPVELVPTADPTVFRVIR